MKKIFLSMFAIATLSISAMAQTGQKGQDDATGNKKEWRGKHGSMDDQFKNLNLTDDQKQQMKTLNDNYRQQMKDLKKTDGSLTNGESDRAQTLTKQHRDAIENLLTPEQKAAMQEQRKGKFKKGEAMKGDRQGKGIKELNLSSDQKTQFKTLNETFKTKMQDIKNNQSLSSQDKKSQAQSLRKQHADDLKGLLTKEQQEKMNGMKSNRKEQSLR